MPKLAGGLWHPHRRKWATERKHLPVQDVAEAGGWSDLSTLQHCYQRATEDTLLKVIETPTKLVGRVVGPIG